MAIAVDWIGASATIPYKARITVPQSYLTWISGTLYSLDTMELWRDMKLEEEAEEGIVFVDLQAHNPNYTVAGVTYADAVFMECEITFENTGSNYSVKLINSNNDIFDEDGGIFVATPGLTLIPGNAAGLIIAETGVSGLTAAESQALLDIDTNVDDLVVDVADLATDTAAMDAKIVLLLAAQDLTNEQTAAGHTTNPTTGKLILRNTVVSKRWEADAWEDAGETIPYRGRVDGVDESGGLESVGQLVEVAWS